MEVGEEMVHFIGMNFIIFLCIIDYHYAMVLKHPIEQTMYCVLTITPFVIYPFRKEERS